MGDEGRDGVSESCPLANGRRERSVVPIGPQPPSENTDPDMASRTAHKAPSMPRSSWAAWRNLGTLSRQLSIRIFKGGPGISVGGIAGLNP